MFRKVNDFDGDGKADFAVTRIENGLKIWYIRQSTAGFRVVHWGKNFDHNAAGDYDGDGKTDVAVYREPESFPSTFTFYILQSQTNTLASTVFTDFGNFGSAPMHQDYNGDGRADPAVWLGEFGLNTNVRVRFSGSDSGFITNIPASQIPIRIGNMEGDARAEKAYYPISGNLVTIIDLATNATRTVQFGATNDRYQAADFDGDGVGDLTIWRPSDGTWWWIRSSDNVVNVATWGITNDTPVPADYDGDGKTDLAIYRRESPQSHYWIYGSKSGVSVVTWGLSTDSAVQY